MRGSIRQRGENTWQVRVSAVRDPLTGRYRLVERTVEGTKRAAQRAAAELVAQLERGEVQAAIGSVADLLDKWMAHLEMRGRAPSTLVRYRSAINVNIKPALGHVRVSKLTPAELDTFYAALFGCCGVDRKVSLGVAPRRQVRARSRLGLEALVRRPRLQQRPIHREVVARHVAAQLRLAHHRLEGPIGDLMAQGAVAVLGEGGGVEGLGVEGQVQEPLDQHVVVSRSQNARSLRIEYSANRILAFGSARAARWAGRSASTSPRTRR